MNVRPLALALALAFVAGCGGGGEPAPEPGSPVPMPAPTPGEVTTSGAPPSSAPPVTPPPAPPPPSAADPSPADPVPRFLTPADDGRTYAMAVGRTAELVLRDAAEPAPVLEGTAVQLIQVVNVAGGSARSWEVRAVEAGSAIIRGSGPDPWEIRLEIE